VGDEFLRRVGKSLKERFRKSDVIGRFGGDEFYMLIPKKGADEIKTIHNKINSILEELSDDFDLKKVVTSSGGAVLLDKGDKTMDIVEIIKLADDMLYKSKREDKGSVNLFVNYGKS
jgi:diguanylate cyclase (GGDEF)-like protein